MALNFLNHSRESKHSRSFEKEKEVHFISRLFYSGRPLGESDIVGLKGDQEPGVLPLLNISLGSKLNLMNHPDMKNGENKIKCPFINSVMYYIGIPFVNKAVMRWGESLLPIGLNCREGRKGKTGVCVCMCVCVCVCVC
jgi:hypothetical protein